MTLYEFNILELNERIEAVNQYGTFLDNHVTKTERCNLYAIDRFFVIFFGWVNIPANNLKF